MLIGKTKRKTPGLNCLQIIIENIILVLDLEQCQNTLKRHVDLLDFKD